MLCYVCRCRISYVVYIHRRHSTFHVPQANAAKFGQTNEPRNPETQDEMFQQKKTLKHAVLCYAVGYRRGSSRNRTPHVVELRCMLGSLLTPSALEYIRNICMMINASESTNWRDAVKKRNSMKYKRYNPELTI